MSFPVRKRRRVDVDVRTLEPDWRKETNGSMLRMHLLEQFSWGFMSPPQTQKIAELAVADARSGSLADLALIAKAGCEGKYGNNVNRDILKLVEQRISVRKNADEDLSASAGARLRHVPAARDLCWDILVAEYPNVWNKTIFPGEKHLQRFWAKARHLPQ